MWSVPPQPAGIITQSQPITIAAITFSPVTDTKYNLPPGQTTMWDNNWHSLSPGNLMSMGLLTEVTLLVTLLAEVFTQLRPGGGRIRFSSPAAARRRTMTRNFVSHLVNFYKDQGLWSEPLEECRKYFKKFFKTLVTKWRDDSHSRLDVGLWIALISRQNTVWPGHQLPTGPTGPPSQLHSGQSVCVRTASSQLRFTKIEVEIRAMARPSPLTGRPKPKFVFVLQLGFVVQFLSCQNGWKGRICTDVRIVEDPLPTGNLPFQSEQDLCLSFYLLPAREREAGVVLL